MWSWVRQPYNLFLLQMMLIHSMCGVGLGRCSSRCFVLSELNLVERSCVSVVSCQPGFQLGTAPFARSCGILAGGFMPLLPMGPVSTVFTRCPPKQSSRTSPHLHWSQHMRCNVLLLVGTKSLQLSCQTPIAFTDACSIPS